MLSKKVSIQACMALINTVENLSGFLGSLLSTGKKFFCSSLCESQIMPLRSRNPRSIEPSSDLEELFKFNSSTGFLDNCE